MVNSYRGILFLLALGVAACGGEPRQGGSVGARATADTGGRMEGMHDMQGMGGMMDSTMMQRMQDHMQMMEGASGGRMRAMMPEHRQMAANMLAQMNRDMDRMKMAGDSTWAATVDSLRQDLMRMPEMDAAELKGFMPAHRARMIRLMQMHRKMMRGKE